MAANRKPRRPYRPRAVIMPLGIKKSVSLEMPGRIGLLALGTGWLDQTHIRDIGAHAALAERVAIATGADGIASESRQVIAVANRCEERFERTGRAGVTGDELQTLRDIVPETIRWLSEQSNHLIHRESLYLVHQFDRAVAERSNAA